MPLKTMEPNPVWSAGAYKDTVDTLAEHGDELVFKVWGGDWCKDCRSQLPDFGAALEAAEVPEENVVHYETEKEEDGSKTGPQVEEYDIEYIPTVIVERMPEDQERTGEEAPVKHGEEIARFVEEADVPIAVSLAEQIGEALA